MPGAVFFHVPQRPDVVRQNAAILLLVESVPGVAVLCVHSPFVEDLPDLRAQRLHHDVVADRPVLKMGQVGSETTS